MRRRERRALWELTRLVGDSTLRIERLQDRGTVTWNVAILLPSADPAYRWLGSGWTLLDALELAVQAARRVAIGMQ